MSNSARVVAILAWLGLLAGPAASQPAQKQVTEAEARKAIALFRDKPFDESTRSAIQEILVFGIQSDKVLVLVGKEEAEWFMDKKDDHSKYYGVAYIAGNIAAQLDSKTAEPDVHAGLREVLRLYQQIKARDKDYRKPLLEAFLALEKEGKLKAHLADVQKKKSEEARKVREELKAKEGKK